MTQRPAFEPFLGDFKRNNYNKNWDEADFEQKSFLQKVEKRKPLGPYTNQYLVGEVAKASHHYS